MTSFIESSAIDIGDGDKFVSLKQVIPDITFNGSTSVNPDVSFTMKSRNNLVLTLIKLQKIQHRDLQPHQ